MYCRSLNGIGSLTYILRETAAVAPVWAAWRSMSKYCCRRFDPAAKGISNCVSIFSEQCSKLALLLRNERVKDGRKWRCLVENVAQTFGAISLSAEEQEPVVAGSDADA